MKSLSSRCVWMQSSQYAVPQQGVLTASRSIRLSMGQTMLGSFEGRSRTSASERALDLTVCLCHDALGNRVKTIERKRRADHIHESGCATTKPPSGVTITPWPIRAPFGLSTAFKKLLGIPVVRFMRGLLSNSRSLFVGQSWIQWPRTKSQTHARGKGLRVTGNTPFCPQR